MQENRNNNQTTEAIVRIFNSLYEPVESDNKTFNQQQYQNQDQNQQQEPPSSSLEDDQEDQETEQDKTILEILSSLIRSHEKLVKTFCMLNEKK